MTTALVSRRRVALHLLLLEAGLLAGILGTFALVSLWLAGAASLESLILPGAPLLASALVAEWILVRLHWKRLDAGFGSEGRAP